jgi:hypothetical protein
VCSRSGGRSRAEAGINLGADAQAQLSLSVLLSEGGGYDCGTATGAGVLDAGTGVAHGTDGRMFVAN